MNLTSTAQLHARARIMQKCYPGWRSGQVYFNLLYQYKPGWADEIRGSLADPFSNDDNLPRFFEYLERKFTHQQECHSER